MIGRKGDAIVKMRADSPAGGIERFVSSSTAVMMRRATHSRQAPIGSYAPVFQNYHGPQR
jgi:hypothetical protein